jgi:ribonuclease BN (tRNA processing enzyme)
MTALAILGSGTAIPHPRRGASGYACLATDGAVLLLECGPGSSRRWPVHGIALDAIAGIVVTHHHVDHVADLAAALFARNVVEPPCRVPWTLAGPVGHAAFVAGLDATYGPQIADRDGLRQVVELDDRARVEIGPFTVEARRVVHGWPGSIAVRVAWDDRSIAFSGDSAPCDALVEICRGADLALLECSYPASRETSGHLTTRTAGEVAQAAGVSRLVLTHFYPALDGVDVAADVRAAGYDGALHLAADGDVLAL